MNIIKGKIAKPQKIIIYGEAGAGKSTLGAKFPKCLFLDIEQSANQLDVERAILHDWDEFLHAIDEVKNLDYETIVVDTLDVLEAMCAEKFKVQILAPKDFGRSFVVLEECFNKYVLPKLNAIIDSGKNVVLLAHNEIKKIELPENEGQYDRHELRLTKRVKALLEGWCDALFFIYRKTMIEVNDNSKNKAIGGKKRWIETNSNTYCVAKCRWNIADNFEAEISEILKHLPQSKNIETPEEEKPSATKEEYKEISDVEKLRNVLGLGEVSEAELLEYLQGKNAKKQTYLEKGKTLEDLQADYLKFLLDEQVFNKVKKEIKG